jgi:hypothetical protein
MLKDVRLGMDDDAGRGQFTLVTTSGDAIAAVAVD